jgi:hypothetical protein
MLPRTLTRVHWTFVGVAIALAAGAVQGTIARAEPAGGPAPALVPTPLARAIHWTTSSRYRYDIQQEVEVLSGESLILNVKLQGHLDITSLGAHSLRLDFVGTVDGLRTGEGAPVDAAATARTVQQELQAPAYIDLSEEDAPDIRVAGAPVSDFVSQLWRHLAFTLRFAPPPEEGTREWQAAEQTSVGRCTFDYARSGARGVTKRAASCIGAPQGERTPVHYGATDLRREYEFTDRGELAQFRVAERVQVDGNAMLPSVTSVASFVLTLRASEPESPERVASFAREARVLKRRSAPDVSSRPGWSRTLDQARVGRRTLPAILANMMQAQRSELKDDRRRAERDYVGLVALLRLEPERHLGPIRQHILADGPLAQQLIGALQDCGTADAQRLMTDLLRNSRMSLARKIDLTRGLSLTPTPTKDTVEVLTQLLDDEKLARQATYGLGSNAHRLRTFDARLAKEVVQLVMTRLAKAESIDVKRDFLVALGNAGAPESLQTAEHYLSSSSELLRGAAAQAIRRIANHRVDQLLASAMDDPAVKVRWQTIEALSERGPTAEGGAALARVLVKDSEAKIRIRAAQLAARWLSDLPALRPVLERTSVSDENDSVRQIARNGLDG